VNNAWRIVAPSKTGAAAAAIVALFVSALPAQEKKKEWKDQAEYAIYEVLTKTSDPKAWLETLDKWSKQYPQSDYADIRRQTYLEAYRTLDRPREAFSAATEVLKDSPGSLVALSVIVGYVYRLSPATPEDLDTAEKAAAYILGNLDTVYSKDNRPPQMSDTEAAKAKPDLKVFAQRTIGWIYYTRKDWEKAEAELTKVLELDPKQGQVSYWLGVAILGQAKLDRQSPALYDFARAAAYDGTGAMQPGDRQQVSSYLSTVYKKYHGSEEGLSQLLSTAKSSALPPSGFTIQSKAELDKKRIEAEDAAAKANPMLALWKSIRVELTGDNGSPYFEMNMKDAALPSGANGVAKFKGKIVSMTPPARPKELTLAIENPSVADVTLKLDSALPGKMEAGQEIEFEGIARSYTREPFMVTFDAEKAKIVGWTGKNEVTKKSSVQKKKS
jgi:tetratricopeptide (TPR) repeat protein